MATYASRHHDVHLLTCTLGEEGEVIPPALAHLGPSADDSLGSWRREELRAAMGVLGVASMVLGEDPPSGVASRYRDSGMAGTASAEHPAAFARADLGEVTAMVADHIRAVRPDVVVTYDQSGGYGHPDHIQTHRVTMAALSALTVEASAPSPSAGGVTVPVAFCILTPRSWAVQDRAWLHEHVVQDAEVLHDAAVLVNAASPTSPNCVVLPDDAPYPPSVVSDETVTHTVEEPDMVEMQSRALAKHATQVIVLEGYYALSNNIAARLGGREGFARFDPVAGHLVPAVPGAPRHHGLLDPPSGIPMRQSGY